MDIEFVSMTSANGYLYVLDGYGNIYRLILDENGNVEAYNYEIQVHGEGRG